MAKKALCIGCNYSGRLKLNGCINDCQDNVQLALSSLGVPSSEITVLADAPISGVRAQPPTKQNILNSIKNLVNGARRGDMLYFSFSGHGTQVPDRSGEEADGMDEAIVPGDYAQTQRVITDDELYAYMVRPLPEGVLLTCVFDCCHAGTILDLDACIDSTNLGKKKAGKQKYLRASRDLDFSEFDGTVLCRAIPPIMNYIPDDIPEPEVMERGGSGPGVFCFSGCRDDQTSLDVTLGGKACGVLTNSLMKALRNGGMESDYESLFRSTIANVNELRGRLSKLTQCPQMSYSESAAPDGVKFCSPHGGSFPAAMPALAPFFIGFQPPHKDKKDKKEKDKKDKKGGKEAKEKKDKKEKKGGKEAKQKKEKKGKKSKHKDLDLDSDTEDSESTDSEAENHRKKADIGKQVLGALFKAFE